MQTVVEWQPEIGLRPTRATGFADAICPAPANSGEWRPRQAQPALHNWLSKQAEWKDLRAVRSGRVAVTDGNQFFNRPGPRVVESAEILAEIFHPAEFNFGHRGAAWVP